MKRFIFLVCIGLGNIGMSLAASVGTDTKITAIGDTGAPILTLSAETLEKGGWSFGQRNEYFKNRSYSEEDLIRLSRENGRGVESNDYYMGNYFAVAYGLLDNLTIGAVLPFTRLGNIRGGLVLAPEEINVNSLGTAEGLSDVTLVAFWKFFNDKENKFSGLIAFGTDVPTGVTDVQDQFGIRLAPGDQPGDGAWNPFLGVAFTKKFDKYSWNANVLYTKGQRGAQDANLGDTWSYNMALVRRFHTEYPSLDWDAMLELDAERYQKTNIAGIEVDPNSGGRTLYLSPGLRLTTKNDFSPYIEFNIPLQQEWNGVQPYVKYSIIVGFDFPLGKTT